MTTSLPAAMALVMSPENFMPPSAMTGTPRFLAVFAAPRMAVIWGTPMPATILVVQIGAGPYPYLHRVAPCVDHGTASFLGGDVPADKLDLREGALDASDRVYDVLGMAVGRVHDDDVATGLHEGIDPRVPIRSDPNGCPHPQPAE